MTWAIIALVVVWSVFPFWWGFASSFKPPAYLLDATMLPILQYPPTLEHWQTEADEAFRQDGMAAALLNGVEVGVATALVALLIGVPAVVGLARFGRCRLLVASLVGLFLLPRVLPPIVTYLPASLLASRFGLADTQVALVLFDATLSLPLAIPVLHSAVRELPEEILEAARLDGTGPLGLLWHFVLPLIRPAVVAVGFLTFVLSWNEFLFALTNHGERTIMPSMVVTLLEDRDGIPFEHVGSHLTLIVLPPLLLAFLAQRYLVRDLTLGAVRDEDGK